MAKSPTVRFEGLEIPGRSWAERVRSSWGVEAARRISVVMTVLNLATASKLDLIDLTEHKQEGSL